MFSSPQGHLEFFICNTDEMEDPDGVPTQECFNKHPLTRADGDDSASLIDPNYPGRCKGHFFCRNMFPCAGFIRATTSENEP